MIPLELFAPIEPEYLFPERPLFVYSTGMGNDCHSRDAADTHRERISNAIGHRDCIGTHTFDLSFRGGLKLDIGVHLEGAIRRR